MSDWSKNNKAHVSTWLSLYVLDQVAVSFKEAKDLAVRDLTFWSPLDSEEMRRAKARTLGVQLDNMFRLIYGATLEEAVEPEQAIGVLQEALAKADTKLPALAKSVDDCYDFVGEEAHV